MKKQNNIIMLIFLAFLAGISLAWPKDFNIKNNSNGQTFLYVSGSSGNVGIGTSASQAGFAVMNGNVGIGTWAPVAPLQIVGAGNVGIGTTIPPQVLYVVGTVQATTGFTAANNVGISTTINNPKNVQITNGIITTWN